MRSMAWIPKVDYEVHAEHGKFVSETKSVSSFLDRFDNVFNFELGSSNTSNARPGTTLAGQAVLLEHDRSGQTGG